jgi:hypothetical protein
MLQFTASSKRGNGHEKKMTMPTARLAVLTFVAADVFVAIVTTALLALKSTCYEWKSSPPLHSEDP